MSGIIITILSAVFLALTEIFDKLMVTGDCYKNSARTPWFVSSLVGSVLGIIATCIVWMSLHDTQSLIKINALMLADTFIPLLLIASGVLTSLTLKNYFKCFAVGSTSTIVGIAIAVTPLFVFGASSFLDASSITLQHGVSLLLAVFGLVTFEYASGKNHNLGSRVTPLLSVIGYGTAYLIVLDETIARIEKLYHVDAYSASLLSLPYYWLGFAFGLTALWHKEVRNFIRDVSKIKKYLFIIFVLEVFGMLFYFFELFGIAILNITFLSVIIGAHVVFVWVFDLYVRCKVKLSIQKEDAEFELLFFKLKTDNFIEYVTSKEVVYIQFMSIVLVFMGLVSWPNIY